MPGAGAFEVAAHAALTSAEFINTVPGRAKYGVKVCRLFHLIHLSCYLSLSLSPSLSPFSLKAFADALMIIPKTLAQNSGFDPQDTIMKLQDEFVRSKQPVGLDVSTGNTCLPDEYVPSYIPHVCLSQGRQSSQLMRGYGTITESRSNSCTHGQPPTGCYLQCA